VEEEEEGREEEEKEEEKEEEEEEDDEEEEEEGEGVGPGSFDRYCITIGMAARFFENPSLTRSFEDGKAETAEEREEERVETREEEEVKEKEKEEVPFVTHSFRCISSNDLATFAPHLGQSTKEEEEDFLLLSRAEEEPRFCVDGVTDAANSLC